MGTARYWALSDEILTAMLQRAHAGEEPEMLLLELYANSDVEDVEPE